jgi:hypothetical protein
MTRATALRSDADYLHQLHDDLASALGETDRLRCQVEQMVETNHNLSALLLSTDARSGDMLKLLVSVRALIESRDAPAAIARLQDILVNVVGAAEFVIYALDDDETLVPIAGAGPFDGSARLPMRASWIGEVVRSGQVLILPPGHGVNRADTTTSAVVPLKVLERVLGAIVIARVLPHRESLSLCDRDVLGLLGAYAATAVIAAERRSEWRRLPMVAL